MARAYFAPYGVGLGHASRLVTIANRLNDYNASIEFSSLRRSRITHPDAWLQLQPCTGAGTGLEWRQ